ncbi:protein PYRICULARIA ORYZAE RESISTANCE 21-like [Agrilus planipennis]|uniref:Protein PYRICULARIA ORYZAE RESISTANCE 21-like n=1 Tax=Agrilus planipennis TaxID=224129 RepID=A0A7F5RF59_AGRPL|nr:protein PYRICULARIA ORYZAE RESISTANCE 21-like [Agrilus planipennis]
MCSPTILAQMKNIICEIDDCCKPCCPCPCPPPACCPPACAPCNPADCNPLCFPPYAQVYLGCCPLPGPLPYRPEPLRPLQLPGPPKPPGMTPDEKIDLRYDNFYNGYNLDWRNPTFDFIPKPDPNRACGQVVDGKSPICNDPVVLAQRRKCKQPEDKPGCPRGYQPCMMKLKPPKGCDPCGIWIAELPPCPKKGRCCN